MIVVAAAAAAVADKTPFVLSLFKYCQKQIMLICKYTAQSRKREKEESEPQCTASPRSVENAAPPDWISFFADQPTKPSDEYGTDKLKQEKEKKSDQWRKNITTSFILQFLSRIVKKKKKEVKR